jgi:hypothetical protein
MINCPVCSHSNDEFSLKCSSCGSFVQDRIPNLDLFSMIWMIIEQPRQAFKKIILAEHKNFVLFLSIFLGISAVFTLLWSRTSGNNFDNILPLMVIGILSGVIVAFPMFLAMVYVFHNLLKLLGGHGSFKNTYAVSGWSLVPIMLSVVFILPLELATLGLIFFSENPNPYDVKPLVYVTLLVFDCVLVLWSLFLAGKGLSLVHKIHILISSSVVLVVVGGFGIVLNKIFSFFNI